MQYRFLSAAVVVVACAFGAGLTLAADNKAGAAPAMADKAKAAKDGAKAPAKAPAKVTQVDINSAKKAELMKLPYVDEAQADKIIAGRPYLTKAHLVTRKILPAGVYGVIKNQIVARQK